MRIVLLGKGGSGKSTLAGLLCVALRQRNERVLAIDADTVPGLAQVLGMEPSDEWDLAGAALRDNGGWRLEAPPSEVVERRARQAPGGIGFLQTGNVDASLREFELRRESHVDRWSGIIAFNTVSRQYDDPRGWAVVDLQGGTVQVATGMAGTTGIALVVVEPFAKSLLTARRFASMGDWPPRMRLAAVANKVRSSEDVVYVEGELAQVGLPLWAAVPADPAIQRAERDGCPLVNVDESAPAKRAVADRVNRLQEMALAMDSTV